MSKVRLSAVRQAVIDYFGGDMSRHLDMATLGHDFDKGDGRSVFQVEARSFADVSGFKKLGSGAYADVYEIDDARVLKIIKKRDSGYARFANICKANRHNPHLPKIHLSAQWAGKQIYILERLSENHPSEDGDNLGFRRLSIKDHFRAVIGRNSDNPFFVLPPAIAEIARLLENMTDDLHSGNMMFRGDVLVVTDPTTCDDGES